MIKNKDEAKSLFENYDITEALKNDEPHDIIHEIADDEVDIYTQDRFEWLAKDNNYYVLEDAIDEFGFPERDGKPDFVQAVALAQYKANENLLWEAWEQVKEANND